MPWKLAFLEARNHEPVGLWRVAFTSTKLHKFKFIVRLFVAISPNLRNLCFLSVCFYLLSIFYLMWGFDWGFDSKVILNTFSGWNSIKGRFISVIGANISCACAKSPEGLSPSAHLADGCLDLILVKHTSRLQYLRHMIRLTSKGDQVRYQNLFKIAHTIYNIIFGEFRLLRLFHFWKRRHATSQPKFAYSWV